MTRSARVAGDDHSRWDRSGVKCGDHWRYRRGDQSCVEVCQSNEVHKDARVFIRRNSVIMKMKGEVNYGLGFYNTGL